MENKNWSLREKGRRVAVVSASDPSLFSRELEPQQMLLLFPRPIQFTLIAWYWLVPGTNSSMNYEHTVCTSISQNFDQMFITVFYILLLFKKHHQNIIRAHNCFCSCYNNLTFMKKSEISFVVSFSPLTIHSPLNSRIFTLKGLLGHTSNGCRTEETYHTLANLVCLKVHQVSQTTHAL